MSGVLDDRFDFILKSDAERVFALRVIGVYLQTLKEEFEQDIREDDIRGISKGKLNSRQKNALYNWVIWGIHTKIGQAKVQIMEMEKKNATNTK